MGIRRIFFLLMGSLVTAAAADPLAQLATDAPFRRMTEAATTNSDRVLKGAVRLGDRHLLSLLDPATGTARWIAEGEELGGLKVISYDPVARVATIRLAGRIEHPRLMPANTQAK
jgi:hypothetical protein